MCGRMVLVVGVGFSINMSPLWGYGGLLVHWLIGLMKPIHCAPLERKVECLMGGVTPPLRECWIYNNWALLTFGCRDMNLDLQATCQYSTAQENRARCPIYTYVYRLRHYYYLLPFGLGGGACVFVVLVDIVLAGWGEDIEDAGGSLRNNA